MKSTTLPTHKHQQSNDMATALAVGCAALVHREQQADDAGEEEQCPDGLNFVHLFAKS